MHRIGTRLVASCAALALLGAACGTEDDGAEQADAARIAALEEELAEAESRNDELASDIEQLEAELEAAREEEDPPPADETDDDDGPTDRPQRMRTAEALPEQLRLLFEPTDLPEGYDPGTTGWRALDPPPELDGPYETPGGLAFALADALHAELLGQDLWETTTRVLLDDSDADQAYVAVLSWGMADDAMIGRDVRMTITRTDAGWEPGGAEERFHCSRGVTDDLCV